MAKKKYTQPPIKIRGARTHNLKNINVEFPPSKLTIVTGVSGSGKSSLAFDTVYAEGQRRYVESLSTYARQFIARMQRPDVDEIEGIPPAVAIEQKNSVKNARSTVGTATEINDYLRILFARIGEIYCLESGEKVVAETPESITKKILALPDKTKFYVLAPMNLSSSKILDATLEEIQRQGFTRIYIDGEFVELNEDWKPPKNLKDFFVVIDRLAVSSRSRTRLAEAVSTALRIGKGRIEIRTTEDEVHKYSDQLICTTSGLKYRKPEPRLFSFANPLGACDKCQGFGRVTGIDWDRVIPNPSLSIKEGVIAPWRGENGVEMIDHLRAIKYKLKIPFDKPWKELTEEQREFILKGRNDWPGVKGYFDWLETKRYKVQARVQLARYRGYTKCPDCEGGRLCREAQAVQIKGKNLPELCTLPIPELRAWFEKLKLAKAEQKTAERPLKEIKSRLDYMMEVGLGYLTLNRQTRTLSGGESQRINLATALGSALTDTLYVLDEPTVGLHSRDTTRLMTVLRKLNELGNTVIVVEHDQEVLRASDYLIDIGPNAGENGGEIVYQGKPNNLPKKDTQSKTAYYYHHVTKNGSKKDSSKEKYRIPKSWITIEGAHENNLDFLTVKIPTGVFCCITGVSGSGKTTLITKCLYANYRRDLGEINVEPGLITNLEGLDQFEEVVLIDQEPIGRSSRSNAATYLKAYDGIRRLMADSDEGKRKGVTARDFSFNVTGGRCETCEGTGKQVIDMQFLADVEVVCETCEGDRFQPHILNIHYHNKNITDILRMTVEEALQFFKGTKIIEKGLRPLSDVGLGYLRLGQATNTLSGGEAQRLKLASYLAEANKGKGNMLLIFDEPTTGLHSADIDKLLSVFDQLMDKGYSLIVIEHNLELIRHCDYMIDLGPDGGVNGGKIIAEGTPDKIMKCKESITGQYLKKEVETRP